MSNTTNTIVVTVDGIDKTSALKKDSIFIRFQLNKRSNICELKFINFKPADRAEIQVSINGVVQFGGYAVTQAASIQGTPDNTVVEWTVECKDWSELFETVVVSGDYVNQEDRQIIINLFSLYMPFALGFTFDSTRTLRLSTTIKFENITLKSALDQLAKLVGANWFVKPNKDIYWFRPSAPEQVGYKISSNPDNSTSFGFLKNSLSYSLDSSTIINQVKVISGFKSTGTKQTDIFTGDGSTKTFTLTSYPDSILYCGYNDGTGNYTIYGSFVGQSPSDKLVSLGGTKRAVVDYVNKTISLEGNSGAAPANATPITVEYYYREKIDQTFDDQFSQEEFGTFPYVIQNKEFDPELDLEEIVYSLLENNSYAKPSLKFSTTKYGLLPGQLLEFDINELDLANQAQINRNLIEDRFATLLENDDYQLLQQDGVGRSFLIQEVSITPVFTPTGFLIVSDVTCGKWTGSLVDSLSTLGELQSATGKTSSPIPTQLSNISSNLGEVVIGRATFTDGGTAPFNWGTPNAASGVIVGLEDTNAARGAMYIYDGGTVRAKLGYMTGLPNIGTVAPTGWGLYTENGYFTGVVAASRMLGGTITGGLISGGTVAGNVVTGGTINGAVITAGSIISNQITGGTISGGLLTGGTVSGNRITGGTITGGVITGNSISGGTITGARVTGGSITGNTILGGTIATGTPPINSSNPGVILDSSGLYGYGSAGLTFRLSSDPAIKPWFSSGTILNTTYEVNTASVIRTGTTNPRIQMDNSGIFAYNSAGSLKFSVDAATGVLTAIDGVFSGSVSASTIVGGTILAPIIRTDINSPRIDLTTSGLFAYDASNTLRFSLDATTGNLAANGATIIGTVYASSIHSSTLSANTITSGTINSNVLNTSSFNTGTITASVMQAGTVTGNLVTAGTITSNQITSGTITGNQINGGTVTGNQISGGTVTGALLSGGTLSLSGGTLTVTSEGINLYQSGTTNIYSDTNSFYTRLRTNGTVVGYSGLRYQAGLSYNDIVLGKDSSPNVPGNYSVKTFGSPLSAFNWTQLDVSGSWGMVLQSNAGKMFEITAYSASVGTVCTAYNITPYSSSSNLQLGDSTNAFRYIYLKDDAGVIRRVSINSSGVLTVT